MKTKPLAGVAASALLAAGLLLAATVPAHSQTPKPLIQSIRPQGTNVVVSVEIPDGVRRITLESRARLGAGTWAPVAVLRGEGAGGLVSFTVPVSKQTELLRVRSDWEEPLPNVFYTGKSSFPGGRTNDLGVSGWWVNDAAGGPPRESTREVVESDIWKVEGDRVYFFNQYRGLQVINIADPDVATLQTSFPMAAAGEQMYVLTGGTVVLLTQQWCSSGTDGSQVLLISTDSNPATLLASLPVPGYITESRLVGDVLYVASQTYQASRENSEVWEWGTQVSSFDLADPAKPVTRNQLWYPGYGNVVAATDTFLFVVTQHWSDWWRSTVRVIDITAVDGAMTAYGEVVPTGRITDKFKLNLEGSLLTTISEDSRRETPWRPLVTRLETFNMPDPRSAGPQGITKLGEVELGQGERLHATRFDGSRVYVVTFFQIDPLWVVDLSDPANPRIAGSVEVPGWSTYIHPMGNRLVTVGVETNQAAVSLFDVQDPARPTLLSRVLLGDKHSGSEAVYDEKAFSVLEDAGLVLVPFSGSLLNEWISGVQLIDLKATGLELRGVIAHDMQPRRATYAHNRVLSVSGWEMLSVDIADRDRPVLKGELDLAFPVSRVVLYGDFLLQVTAQTDWITQRNQSVVRLSTAATPGNVLSKLDLGTVPIVGVSLQGTKLHVAQSTSSAVWPYWWVEADGSDATPDAPFTHTVIDLAGAPAMAIAGQVTTNLARANGGSDWRAVWPQPDVVVWVGGGSSYFWGGPWVLDVGAPVFRGGLWAPWPLNRTGGGELVSVDVSRADKPEVTAWLDLVGTNQWSSISRPFVHETLVYLSYATIGPAPDSPNTREWVQSHYLSVIDYHDATAPVVRPPVNLPGTLRGVARAGELLFATATRSPQVWGDEWLDALAYDGIKAHLIDSLLLATNWPNPVLTLGEYAVVGVPKNPAVSTSTNELQTWSLNENGKFTLRGTLTMAEPVSSLELRNTLLAGTDTYSRIQLFKAVDPPALEPLKVGQQNFCFWYDIGMADGDLQHGFFLPLGSYGVGEVNLAP